VSVATARKRIRVLAVDHTAGVRPFRRKFAALAAHGDIALTVLAPDRWVENYRPVRASATTADGYRFEVGKIVWPGYENRAFFLTGLAGAIRRARPHILHLWEEPFSLIALQALVLRRVLAPRAKALFFSSDNLHADFDYPYRPAKVYEAIERYALRACEEGTAVSGEVANVLRAKGYRGTIDVVPHGLDLEAYPERTESSRAEARSRLGIRDGGPIIAYVGRLLAMKGVDVLLRAVSSLPAPAAGAPPQVLIVGDGPERDRLLALARSLGIGDRTVVIPPVPHEEVPRVLGAIDILVMHSLTTPTLKEQFGRVAMEGMAAACAVVVSDSGALPWVVGDAGVVTPEGDVHALAAALSRLLHSAEERAARGERGRARVRGHFTWSAIAEALAARYRALAEPEGGGTEAPAA